METISIVSDHQHVPCENHVLAMFYFIILCLHVIFSQNFNLPISWATPPPPVNPPVDPPVNPLSHLNF